MKRGWRERLRDIWDAMKDLEMGGWSPLEFRGWVLHVTWSDWQVQFGTEYSHDPGGPMDAGAKWVSMHVYRLSLQMVKEL